jgi:Transposase IS116/IS110/IS902 family
MAEPVTGGGAGKWRITLDVTRLLSFTAALLGVHGQADSLLIKAGSGALLWLALTPKQYSTGGKTRLGQISKHGDRYLRTLLVHGAHSMLLLNWKKSDRKRRWAEALMRTSMPESSG